MKFFGNAESETQAMKVQNGKRIHYTFLTRQEIDGSSNAFLNFIKKSLKPVRFINGQNGDYDEILLEINKPLMLMGLQMTNEPKILTLKYNQ